MNGLFSKRLDKVLSLLPTDLSVGKTQWGVSHVGCSMAALIARGECIAGEKDRHEDEAYTG